MEGEKKGEEGRGVEGIEFGKNESLGGEKKNYVLLRGRRTKAGLAHEQKPMSSVNLSPDSQ